MKTAITNRWGTLLTVGATVTVHHPRGDSFTSTITKIETKGEYARAYGSRVILASGGSASIDDCRLTAPDTRAVRLEETREELRQLRGPEWKRFRVCLGDRVLCETDEVGEAIAALLAV